MRPGLPEGLPGIDGAAASLRKEQPTRRAPDQKEQSAKLDVMVVRQRAERTGLTRLHDDRVTAERHARRAGMSLRVRAVWSKITGRSDKHVARMCRSADACTARDRRDVDALVEKHLSERWTRQAEMSHAAAFQKMQDDLFRRASADLAPSDPRQRLVLSDDTDLPVMVAIELRPDVLLDQLTETSGTFSDRDISSLLGKVSDDPACCDWITKRVMVSPDLVSVSSDTGNRYTSRANQLVQHDMMAIARDLSQRRNFRVADHRLHGAKETKNAELP